MSRPTAPPQAKAVMTAATRLSARLQENLSEAARDFGIAGSIDTLLGPSSGAGKHLEQGALGSDDSGRDTRKLLASSRDREKEEGLRRVLALMLKGRPVAGYFPLVSNCLSSSSMIVRSLVSVYILRQARGDPDLALMCVNMYQKDLGDPNPAIRAQALRVLVGMDLEAISGMIVMRLKQATRDSNWYVRKIVAHALVQLYRSEPAHLGSIISMLETLFTDRSPLVVGSAAAAFNDICPTHFELVHPVYRRFCRAILDADEWGQCALIHLLQRYARANFKNPGILPLASDLDLLVSCAIPLLQSRNPAVVMGVVGLIHNIAPHAHSKRIAGPILRLLHSSTEIQSVVLADATILCAEYPNLFSAHYADFFVRSTDSASTKQLKLQCLVSLATSDNVSHVVREFQIYARDSDGNFAAEAVNAMAACAARQPKVADRCIQALQMLTNGKAYTVSRATLALQRLLQRDGQMASARMSIIHTLVQHLQAGHIEEAAARASVYWLVGAHADDGLLQTYAPDVLRTAAKHFATEECAPKFEIVNLSAKLLVLSFCQATPVHLRQLSLLFEYVCTLARYDMDYSVRDRARFAKGLVSAAHIGSRQPLSTVEDVEGFKRGEEAAVDNVDQSSMLDPLISVSQVRSILCRNESDSSHFMPATDSTNFATLSLVAGRPLHQTANLPPWTQHPSDSSLRDEVDERNVSTEPTPVLTDAASNQFTQTSSSGKSAQGRPGMVAEQLVPKTIKAAPRTATAHNLDAFLNSDQEEISEEEESESESESEEEESEESDDDSEEEVDKSHKNG